MKRNIRNSALFLVFCTIFSVSVLIGSMLSAEEVRGSSIGFSTYSVVIDDKFEGYYSSDKGPASLYAAVDKFIANSQFSSAKEHIEKIAELKEMSEGTVLRTFSTDAAYLAEIVMLENKMKLICRYIPELGGNQDCNDLLTQKHFLKRVIVQEPIVKMKGDQKAETYVLVDTSYYDGEDYKSLRERLKFVFKKIGGKWKVVDFGAFKGSMNSDISQTGYRTAWAEYRDSLFDAYQGYVSGLR